ncbi:MAG TPA: DUF1343 domain-containing protein [Gemmatimonadales bacterium]
MRGSRHRSVPGLGLLLMVAACRPQPSGPVLPLPVRPGLEVLLTDSLHLVRGRRVGLVSNQSGIDRRGVHGVDRLLAAGVRLVALFSPEHGFRGQAEPGESIATTTDSATGLPIYSLYGTSMAPSPEVLDGLDVILVDLQDVGARYYTWVATTVEVMRAAWLQNKTVVILDRPNPIGGAVQGNVLDPAYRSAVGKLTVPIRHGLTLGELALLARRELGVATDVRVVPAAGWSRSVTFERTGLPFRPPSPNLRDLEALFHYPGVCLFEGTALSVGRGSDAPFHQIGAPWLDPVAVLARVHEQPPPGVRLEPVTFTPVHPGDGKYADTALVGIRWVMTDQARYDPVRTAVVLLKAIRDVHPDQIRINPRSFDRLAGGPGLREALEAGLSTDRIVAGWKVPTARFRERAKPVLRYPTK